MTVWTFVAYTYFISTLRERALVLYLWHRPTSLSSANGPRCVCRHVVPQVARKLAMVEADLERAEERAETGES